MFLGRLPGMKNGFVNVGPGFNGWKIAAGTGEFLARVMELGPDKASHKITAMQLSNSLGQKNSDILRRISRDLATS